MNLKFTLPKKIVINNAFYLLPITVLLYLMISGFSKDITFAEKEIAGADINKIAISLLQKTVNPGLKNEELEKEVKELIIKRDQYNRFLNFDPALLTKKGKDSLQSETFKTTINEILNSSEQAGSDKLIVTLNDLVSHVGDTSNLILDPDLDTYYLMDATIYAVPQLVNRLNEINNFIKNNSSSLVVPGSKENMKLNSLIEIVKNVDSTRLMGDMDTSMKEDVNFYGENALLQKEVKNSLANLDKSLKSYLEMLEKNNFSEKTSNEALATAYLNVGRDLHLLEAQSIDALSLMLESRVSSIKSSRLNSLFIAIASVLMAIVISFYITRTIKKDLNSLISKLSDSSAEVEVTSMKSMDISTELSSSVTQQASSVQEISSTTEEISQMTQKNNESIKFSMQATSKTVDTVNAATDLMNELSQTIQNLKHGNDQIIERSNLNSKSFESITGIMKTIEDKTKVIDDIVFQTKLLSFNASVEAARAGEQGKGFAVVAEEVGNLAKMSGTASQEITELLDSSLKKVRELTLEADKEIKKVVDLSTNNIEMVIQKVHHYQDINKEILTNSDEVTSLISEVVVASEQQTKGIMEITKTIGTFDVVSDRNSQLANELNNASKSLSDKSTELRDVIGSLVKMAGAKSK